MVELTAAIAAGYAVLAGLAGWFASRWLGTRAYRYEEEQDLPLRSVRWVIPSAVLLGLLVGLASGRLAIGPVHLVAGLVLLVLTAIDIDVRRLPDRLTKPLAAGLLVALLAVALIDGSFDSWVRAVLAGLTLGAVYLVLVLVGGGGMGLGDAKLAPSLGMLLGFQSWSHVLLGSMVTLVVAGLAALYLVLFRGAGRKSHMAFGPFLVVGTLVVLLAPALAAI